MSRKIKSVWPFTRKGTISDSSLPMSPLPKDIISAKYYQSINNLPLAKFIDCMVDGNLYSLVISGHPTLTELDSAWADLRQQYADKMGDTEYKLYLVLYKQINILNLNIQLVKELIGVLSQVYVKQFADKLNRILNTNFTFFPEDKEAYDKLLTHCANRSKAFLIQLEIKLIEFKGMQEKYEKEGSKPTREYFQSMLITLSDSAQFLIPDSITVFEFCERTQRVYARIKSQQVKPTR